MKSWQRLGFFFFLLMSSLRAEEAPQTLMLTWEGDPCRMMVAQWLRGPGLGERPEGKNPEKVVWRKSGKKERKVLTAEVQPFPDPDNKGLPRWSLVKVRWKRLEPNTEYSFKIGNSPEMKFRTAPEHLQQPITFTEGGDVNIQESSATILSMGAKQDPLFISVGGDLAYGDGHDVTREIAFWQQWNRAARAPDGRLIPFVAGIGNHEVNGGYVQEGASFAQMKARAPFFYALFGGLYQKAEPVALDFGDYLSMLLMDSGHVLPISSQTGWLKKNLKDRQSVPWVFASWHVPAFPSTRTWNDQKEIIQTREEWLPVLEASQVAGVFNHHDHNLQRVETEGKGGRKITFFGNGALGVAAHPQQCAESRLLAKAFAQSDYVNVVQLRKDGATIRSLGPNGQELDRTDLAGPGRR
ncbi:Metallophos domain-containing protein [Gammaproteobacteria bacterium]